MRDLARKGAGLRALPTSVSSDDTGFLGGGTMSAKQLPRRDETCGGSGDVPVESCLEHTLFARRALSCAPVADGQT